MSTPSTSQAPSLRGRGHIPALDGIRGIAVLLVLAGHNLRFPPGWVGVDLFFVLSGFLITRILLETRESPQYFKAFYLRRFLRIFPAYYLTVHVVLLLAGANAGQWFWHLAYLGNMTGLAEHMFVPELEHTWSLATEEQFYLLWPLLVSRVPPRRLASLCWLLLLGALVARLRIGAGDDLIRFYTFGPLTHSDGLLVGALVALRVHGGWTHTRANIRGAQVVFFVCIAIMGGMAVTGHMAFTRHSTVMSVLGVPSVVFASAAGLWWAISLTEGSWAHRVLTGRSLTYVGRISYGLYLYHIPVLLFGMEWLGVDDSNVWRYRAVGLGLAFVAFGVAALSWRAFEAPIQRLKKRFPYD